MNSTGIQKYCWRAERLLPGAVTVLLILLTAIPAQAHHVSGRPAYNSNEDPDIPPSMQVETQIGNYFITYMVFPAFPRAGERGHVNLNANRIDSGDAYNGEVTFEVKNDVLFGNDNAETLGTQLADDGGVFSQDFEFSADGKYIITALFEADGEPYMIDFPLLVGAPSSIGPIGLAVATIVVILVGVNLVQRKRLQRTKLRNAHKEKSTEPS